MCVRTNYKSLNENFIKMNSRSHRSKLLDNKNITKNNKRMYGLVLYINVRSATLSHHRIVGPKTPDDGALMIMTIIFL